MWPAFALALALSDAASADAAMLQRLHEGHLRALADAHLDVRLGERPEVKRYAQALVEGHQTADQQVTNAAALLGLTLEAAGGTSAELEGMSGRQLDRAFVKLETSSHERGVKALEGEEGKLQDKNVQQLWKMEVRLWRAFRDKADKLEAQL